MRAHHLLLSLLRIFWRPFSQALKTFGSDIGIAFSGAEDVALIEYAHLTGRPYRVFRLVAPPPHSQLPSLHACTCAPAAPCSTCLVGIGQAPCHPSLLLLSSACANTPTHAHAHTH